MKTVFDTCGMTFDVGQEPDGTYYAANRYGRYPIYTCFVKGDKYIVVNGVACKGTVKIIPEQGEDVAAMFVTKMGRNYPIHQIGIKFYATTRCGKGLPIGRNHYGAFIVVNGITVYGKVRVKAGRKPL